MLIDVHKDFQDVVWDYMSFDFIESVDPDAVQKIIDKYDFGGETFIDYYGTPPNEHYYLDFFCPTDPECCFGIAKFLTEICGTKVEWDHEDYHLTDEQLALEKTAEPVRFPLKEQTAKS